ncbi:MULTISPECIES: hemin uptake protein HemP [unclassified Luteimonas]|uniref:hemin uptake protein HemP n=1 Tax=unclassified Luteimonas TaxID=2629088 RepID=UPI0018F06AF0|nr:MULTISPECIES: hemin uptake protein HemP [unclassified Luteimonas]MBJ6978626.1 hemin uptake protein HemP [Luteimonas sp. MC1895]MBJ6983523.1 hemin uptake protein HemP [Luteimonas sp. MC1750]QQO06370.1 hemin uptake protein HemP [Luteimonas sp. MC1750]
MLASRVHPSAFEAADDLPSAGGADAPVERAEVDSLRLLDGQREVLIRHGNELYRLRHTRNDKLILTK